MLPLFLRCLWIRGTVILIGKNPTEPRKNVCLQSVVNLCSSFCWTLFFVWQGKFIRINFDVNGYIVGANIETCILFLRGAFHTCDTTGSTCWVDGLQAKVNHPRVSWLTVMISLSFIWLNEATVWGEVLFPRCARPWPQPDQICWKSLGPSVKRKRSGASTSSTTCCRGPAKNCAVRDFPAFPRFPSHQKSTLQEVAVFNMLLSLLFWWDVTTPFWHKGCVHCTIIRKMMIIHVGGTAIKCWNVNQEEILSFAGFYDLTSSHL